MARLLLIDDDGAILEVMARMLRPTGHEVLTHTGGLALWQVLREAAFDLVLTDLDMPALDGWAVGLWLRHNRRGVPVIAVTGLPPERHPPATGSPFDTLLTKPVRRALLLATVAQALGQRTG